MVINMQFSSVSPVPRRTVVRLASYIIFMAAVLVFVIGMQMQMTERLTLAQNRLRRSVLVRMNEEHEALKTALSSGDREDVLYRADVLCGYASMLPACGGSSGEAPLISALSDTALFYAALMRVSAAAAEAPIPDAVFWAGCADTVSEYTASLALALSDRAHPGTPSDAELSAAEQLSAFCTAFRTDPLKISSAAHPGYRFDRESPVTEAEARQKLRTLVGNAASFLGTAVTDDIHGCYVFSCQNGYAEVSRCGGHLLSYAFYPRSTSNTASHLLNDADLSELAVTFLKKNAIPVSAADIWEDRHGIRMFRVKTKDGEAVTVGIRMHDGVVVHFAAEGYYRRNSSRG